MSKPLVPDELWKTIEPLLPQEPPKPKEGRPRFPDRAALCGIIFVLRRGPPWEMLLQEMGCGSAVTCWRRLRDWQQRGVWRKLHWALLDLPGEADKIDWSRASLDSDTVRAKGVKKGTRKHRLLGRTPQIRANRARSAILWSNDGAYPSR